MKVELIGWLILFVIDWIVLLSSSELFKGLIDHGLMLQNGDMWYMESVEVCNVGAFLPLEERAISINNIYAHCRESEYIS